MDTTRLIKDKLSIEDVAMRLGIRFNAAGVARCPFPENYRNGDRNPSLRLNRERGQIKCWSQHCFGEQGVDMFGLVMKLRNTDCNGAKKYLAEMVGVVIDDDSRRGRRSASYPYENAAGDVLNHIDRFESDDGAKRFQDRPAGVKDRVLYRWPELRDSGDPVVIPEGEKKVDVLRKLGFTATTNPFGAGKWRDDFVPQILRPSWMLTSGERRMVEELITATSRRSTRPEQPLSLTDRKARMP